MLVRASTTPAMANAKPIQSSVPGTAHTMIAAIMPAATSTAGKYKL